MDKRSADMQAKARLLGVPLSCGICEYGCFSGTRVMCCENQWATDNDTSDREYGIYMHYATHCEHFNLMWPDWMDDLSDGKIGDM